MLITFFDIKGIVHFEFMSQGQTVIQAYCVEILKQLLHEAVCKKRLELLPTNWILHHGNAPAYKALHQAVLSPEINY